MDLEKSSHWDIIKKRTYQMIEQGLIEEVEEIIKKGLNKDSKPLLSIGYKETMSYIDGKIKSKEELTEKIFFATRKLAKSQKTFLNKVSPLMRLHPLKQRDDIFSCVEKFLM